MQGESLQGYGFGVQELYAELDRYLGKKDDRPSPWGGVESRVVRLSDSEIALTYHRTAVVTIHAEGTITLNSGGWATVTTKRRMNEVLQRVGLGVSQKNFDWYVFGLDGEEPVMYRDRMTMKWDGSGWRSVS